MVSTFVICFLITRLFNGQHPVIKYTTPWGYPHFEVHGSVATYEVTLNMIVSPIPFYCNCPAFAYAVLTAGSHIMVRIRLEMR